MKIVIPKYSENKRGCKLVVETSVDGGQSSNRAESV
jgi:hypothetical protein